MDEIVEKENKYFAEPLLNIENPLVLGGGLGTSPGQPAVPEGFLSRELR